MSAYSRVQIEYVSGGPGVDMVMPSAEVHEYLAPLRQSGVFHGGSRGGRLDRYVDGVLTLIAHVSVTDVVPHVDYPHEPGYLYDCAACEQGPCQCVGVPGRAPCVSRHCERPE